MSTEILPQSAQRSAEELGRAAVVAADAVLDTTARFTPEHLAKVETLKDKLRGQGWQTARSLSPATGFDERVLRSLAEASDGEIITGNFGYRLTCEATPQEIMHAEARLLSQARQMTDRARKIRLAMNRRTAEGAEGRRDITNVGGGGCVPQPAAPNSFET